MNDSKLTSNTTSLTSKSSTAIPRGYRQRARILCRWMLIAGIACGGVLGIVTLWVKRQSSHVPDFYVRAINRNESGRAEDRTKLFAEVEKLQKDASRCGQWKASFDQDRINAWLADEVPRKFARLLAHGADEPAISIEDGAILAAVRYKSTRLDTVVSCRLSVEMTEEPNLLAVRLSELKAGSLPLPLDPFVRKISREAALGDLDIRWDFTESGPVALVTIPDNDPRYVIHPVIIESIDVSGGRLTLAGRTGDMAAKDYSPQGPVHRFVSFRPSRSLSPMTSSSRAMH